MPSAYSNIVQVHIIGPTFFTSRPYPIQDVEAMQGHIHAVESPQTQYTEAMQATADFIDGELKRVLDVYDTGEPEAIEATADFLAGELKSVLDVYDDGLPEAMTSGADFIAGELKAVLVTYDNGEPEAMTGHCAFISGTLT
jgi:hypothetical protein